MPPISTRISTTNQREMLVKKHTRQAEKDGGEAAAAVDATASFPPHLLLPPHPNGNRRR